jgi:hypothetical protein
MNNPIQGLDYRNYIMPVGLGIAGVAFSNTNRGRNALIGLAAGTGLMLLLNRTAKLDINNFEQDRRLNVKDNGAVWSGGNRDQVISELDLTENVIANKGNFFLPLPTQDASYPNAIDLPNGRVLLLPAPMIFHLDLQDRRKYCDRRLPSTLRVSVL